MLERVDTPSGARTASEDPMTADRARLMFGRYLRNWASDTLELRRRGLDRPGLRCGLDREAQRDPPGRRAA